MDEILRRVAGSPDNRWWSFRRLTELYAKIDPPLRGKYLHWDKFRRYPQPSGLSHEESWYMIKTARLMQAKPVPLRDGKGRYFTYVLAEPIPEVLHKIDQGAGGYIQMPDQITNPDLRDQYLVNSLVREAITSSQLEGAATTRLVAKEMIRTRRAPRDKSEQMILNNFRTMQQIGHLKDQPLTQQIILDLHRIATEKTLPDESGAGRLRQTNEPVVVADMYNEVFHTPPCVEQLEERMAALCDFANSKSPAEFIHPVLRSIILHFWLAYDHPFVDGNGRVARALFYWSMLRHGYWLFEFVSISHILLKAPAKYARAFLYTETDENDLTYFILHQLDVIQRAIKELHDYIARKTSALQAIENRLHGLMVLNHRQQALISHALRHPQQRYTFSSHQMSHNVVYQTARTDLLYLERRGLLTSQKVSRTWYFTPAPDLEDRLSRLD
ncbi:MAG: Fic family protein [Sedimentisphaerales bacterium]|nr:Fic family protein [Sedimentisphaerales bacterium]